MAEKSDWEKTETFQLRVSTEFLRILDEWRRHQEDLPNRSEAIRRLVEAGTHSKGGVRVKEKRGK
jgi:hypothetical protein